MPCCRPLRLTMPCGTPATWRGLARRARGARKRFGGCWRLLQQEVCDLFGGLGEGEALAGSVVEFVDDCVEVRFGDGLKSVPLGKYCLSRPLVFSLVPRCQGACGSQKKTSIPAPMRICFQSRISGPWSQVSERRSAWGSVWILFARAG